MAGSKTVEFSRVVEITINTQYLKITLPLVVVENEFIPVFLLGMNYLEEAILDFGEGMISHSCDSDNVSNNFATIVTALNLLVEGIGNQNNDISAEEITLL